ncbi:MAG: phosphoribosylformylglycinamidine synthase [Spirochaetaceae bacterium]|nr:phosphoribosylformylglycinamidine synthase [Spirochaetaceae bacterium]
MFRLYIERKIGFQNEASRIFSEVTGFLGIPSVTNIRYLNRYDIENVSEETVKLAAVRVFSEPQSDTCFFTHIPLRAEDTVIIWEYLPGQYDQRSDSAEQCLSLLQAGLKQVSSDKAERPKVRCAKMVIISGTVSTEDVEKIKNYLINPVDSRLAMPEIPETLAMESSVPNDIPSVEGFIAFDGAKLAAYHQKMGLAMDVADITFLQNYFKQINRNPTETEIRVLDTYWSDHCRHTTFNTVLDDIQIEDGSYANLFRRSLEKYTAMRTEIHAGKNKPVTLMDMATIGAKYLKRHGKLDDIELSEEINACSIYIDVKFTHPEPKTERWLLMFKNETHNHPTEIEPFGGAATCIGGAIRDPLSGRSWVYQALRVTGAANPTVPLKQTREGKLPQIKLTREAAAGFSSYGNQIGLTTGQVVEVYHPGFEAKRMELGAVIAAAPANLVKREEPEAGDIVVLVGGGTGRDGIGGATGSSKVHTTKSVVDAAAEVQKGNAVEERKIQRLFRNPEVSKIIRRCNDFGAGGVAVAVGELAPGLDINLDAVPKKYDGLNGTELAISESQERMALVVRKGDVEKLMKAAAAENLNAAVIAEVTDTNRLVMKWRGKTIVDIHRSFLDTAGASRNAVAVITSPDSALCPFTKPLASVEKKLFGKTTEQSVVDAWQATMADLACCSQRGLTERFDGSIGSASVLFPMGGKYQSTPEAGMAAKIPVLPPAETSTVSLMSYGYDANIAQWSPWHGAQVAVLSSLAKIAAMGGNPATCRLTFQEYFERTVDAGSWGKPAAALLGALEAQKLCGTASIGGKDSMSGSFQELKVPPTLVSFAVTTEDCAKVRGGSLAKENHPVYLMSVPYSEDFAPNFEVFNKNAQALYSLEDKVVAAYPVSAGGIAEAVTKMAMGNKVGVKLFDIPWKKDNVVKTTDLFIPKYGSIVFETTSELAAKDLEMAGFVEGTVTLIGETIEQPIIQLAIPSVPKVDIKLSDLEKTWESTLAKVFPPISEEKTAKSYSEFATKQHDSLKEAKAKFSAITIKTGNIKPKVLVPVFPGTNCEFDMARAFALAGADAKIMVFRNNSPAALEESLVQMQKELSTTQILALAGGFSAGDEPDGSGKFIANVLREPRICEAVTQLLEKRDGLALGICNGFQALIKTGLVPFGKIMEPSEEMPTLTYNTIGRHISRIVRTRMVSAISPWASHESVLKSEVHFVPISHGEGRIVISEDLAKVLFANGQVFTQYVSEDGIPVASEPDNPNGSAYAIEGITSPDGRVLGKMGHNERTLGTGILGCSEDLIKNVAFSGDAANKASSCQNIFAAGVSYFA